MVTGTITVPLRAVSSRYSVNDTFEFRLVPASTGAGGTTMVASATLSGLEPQCRITNLPCVGAGTTYNVHISSTLYEPEGFVATVAPGEQVLPGRVMMVNPSQVKGIQRPSWDELKPELRMTLENADVAQRQLRGAALYDALQPEECACLLNLFQKARFGTSVNVWQWVSGLRRVQQDRIYVVMDSASRAIFDAGAGAIPARFKAADKSLHTALPGFTVVDSFKSDDEYASLQVTFQRSDDGSQWAADIDIDEASGLGHAGEVVRNLLTGAKTNPYRIHQLLTRWGKNQDAEMVVPYELILRT